MLTFDDKGGWGVKKNQKLAYVILGCYQNNYSILGCFAQSGLQRKKDSNSHKYATFEVSFFNVFLAKKN